jgi:hypothetical protein
MESMSNSAEEVERGRAMAERAVRELCQAQGRKQPRLEWAPATDTSQRVEILISDLDPIAIEFTIPLLTAQGGIGAARLARQALTDALRSR